MSTRGWRSPIPTSGLVNIAGRPLLEHIFETAVDALAERLDTALAGARPLTSPVEHAQQYDWDAIAEQAETAYQRGINRT